MVESAEDPSCPHVFTSVLLGVLACVLMTGGVFLAFHRWDPLWLIVSGVGVILVLVGSILHCCRPSGGSLPHLHPNHVLLNSGSLTEQLLPHSNARSVSQLSLNMLPGYFPPVVTTYGIEQHSAVVQNIHRSGKNFILLSLPGSTPRANIQNLVATVYQLDGSVLAETSNSTGDLTMTPSVSTASSAVQSNIPVLKNAQVQTCAAWSVPNAAITNASPSTSDERCCSPISTQTDIHLMDYLPDPVCDSSSVSNEVPSPEILVDISEALTSELEANRTSLTNISDSPNLSEVHPVPQLQTEEPSEVLVDITEIVLDTSSLHTVPTEAAVENDLENDSDNYEESMADLAPSIINQMSLTVLPGSPSNSNSEALIESARLDIDVVQNDHSENSSSLSLVDVNSLGRSSPPPRYEDVALGEENTLSGVFGLAYGTL